VKDCIRCHTPLPVDGRFCSNCGTPSGELSHACPPDPTEELKERLARTLVGRYKIIRLLGRGGMAVVFLAQDLVLEREVAIKVLPPDMSHDTKLIPRFHQEARTAAKLDHPNIIPIYRVESEAGLNYFVMKYVNGRPLDQVLDDGPLPVAQARRVLREAALALGHAHQRKVVHRDVKPANIMLEADGRVVLTDFGISKAAQGSSQLTGTGAIIGTPHYMAPEQAKGLEVDGRADQYALAIVGHQLLTGKVPFDGTAHSILYKQVFEPPPPVIQVRPDTPKDLSRALERALSKDPEQRFPSMEDFAAAVSGERAGTATVVSTPVKPVTKGSQPRSAEPKPGTTSRPMLLAFIVAVLGIAVAAWLGLVPTGATKPLPPKDLVLPRPAPTQPAPAPTVTPEAPSALAQPRAPSEPPKPRAVKREYALLTVASEPWGTLYIDNMEIGPTPVADYRLSPGTYRLRIEQEGYRTKKETIVISSPNPIRKRYSLEPQ
jgi:serine/threonine protein kinase